MSDSEQSKEGAGKVVALVFAFLLMPLSVYLLARAGYTGGRNEVDFMLMSQLFALALWGAGMMAGVIQAAVANIARGSSRFVVRRLALFTLIISIAGGVGSCAGGCVWGMKAKTGEWPPPDKLR